MSMFLTPLTGSVCQPSALCIPEKGGLFAVVAMGDTQQDFVQRFRGMS